MRKFLTEQKIVLVIVLILSIIYPIVILCYSPYAVFGRIPREIGLQLVGYGGSILGGFLTLYGVWWTIKDQQRKTDIVNTNENLPTLAYEIKESPLVQDSGDNIGAIGNNVNSVVFVKVKLKEENFKKTVNYIFSNVSELKIRNINSKAIRIVNVIPKIKFYNNNSFPFEESTINDHIIIEKENETVINYRIISNYAISLKFRVNLSRDLMNKLMLETKPYYIIEADLIYSTDFDKKYMQKVHVLTSFHYDKEADMMRVDPWVSRVEGLTEL